MAGNRPSIASDDATSHSTETHPLLNRLTENARVIKDRLRGAAGTAYAWIGIVFRWEIPKTWGSIQRGILWFIISRSDLNSKGSVPVVLGGLPSGTASGATSAFCNYLSREYILKYAKHAVIRLFTKKAPDVDLEANIARMEGRPPKRDPGLSLQSGLRKPVRAAFGLVGWAKDLLMQFLQKTVDGADAYLSGISGPAYREKTGMERALVAVATRCVIAARAVSRWDARRYLEYVSRNECQLSGDRGIRHAAIESILKGKRDTLARMIRDGEKVGDEPLLSFFLRNGFVSLASKLTTSCDFGDKKTEILQGFATAANLKLLINPAKTCWDYRGSQEYGYIKVKASLLAGKVVDAMSPYELVKCYLSIEGETFDDEMLKQTLCQRIQPEVEPYGSMACWLAANGRTREDAELLVNQVKTASAEGIVHFALGNPNCDMFEYLENGLGAETVCQLLDVAVRKQEISFDLSLRQGRVNADVLVARITMGSSSLSTVAAANLAKSLDELLKSKEAGAKLRRIFEALENVTINGKENFLKAYLAPPRRHLLLRVAELGEASLFTYVFGLYERHFTQQDTEKYLQAADKGGNALYYALNSPIVFGEVFRIAKRKSDKFSVELICNQNSEGQSAYSRAQREGCEECLNIIHGDTLIADMLPMVVVEQGLSEAFQRDDFNAMREIFVHFGSRIDSSAFISFVKAAIHCEKVNALSVAMQLCSDDKTRRAQLLNCGDLLSACVQWPKGAQIILDGIDKCATEAEIWKLLACGSPSAFQRAASTNTNSLELMAKYLHSRYSLQYSGIAETLILGDAKSKSSAVQAANLWLADWMMKNTERFKALNANTALMRKIKDTILTKDAAIDCLSRSISPEDIARAIWCQGENMTGDDMAKIAKSIGNHKNAGVLAEFTRADGHFANMFVAGDPQRSKVGFLLNIFGFGEAPGIKDMLLMREKTVWRDGLEQVLQGDFLDRESYVRFMLNDDVMETVLADPKLRAVVLPGILRKWGNEAKLGTFVDNFRTLNGNVPGEKILVKNMILECLLDEVAKINVRPAELNRITEDIEHMLNELNEQEIVRPLGYERSKAQNMVHLAAKVLSKLARATTSPVTAEARTMLERWTDIVWQIAQKGNTKMDSMDGEMNTPIALTQEGVEDNEISRLLTQMLKGRGTSERLSVLEGVVIGSSNNGDSPDTRTNSDLYRRFVSIDQGRASDVVAKVFDM